MINNTKVGIITITKDLNFGNRLQNYALQKFLNAMNVEAETIMDTYNCFHIKFNWIDYIKKNKIGMIFKVITNHKEYRDNLLLKLSRQPKFIEFNNKYIHFSKLNCYYENTPTELGHSYDYFIVGSDQVWNPHFKCTNLEFLTFAPKNKRIAYAASFGISEIPEKFREKFKAWLKGMKYISVRENAGVAIIKDLIDKEDVPVLVDPTLLLTKDEWLEIAQKPDWYKGEKYILTYYLGEKPEGMLDEVELIAKQNNLRIFNLLDSQNMDLYSIGPSEFLYLVQHCSIMYTDSFHGTVFSILMQVPFVICERVQNKMKNMNSRIDTLLDMFSLQSRRGTVDNNYRIENPMYADYSNIEKVLSSERTRAKKYLKEALSLNAGEV